MHHASKKKILLRGSHILLAATATIVQLVTDFGRTSALIASARANEQAQQHRATLTTVAVFFSIPLSILTTLVNYRGGKAEGYVAAALLFWAEEDGRGSAVPANVGFRLPDGSCLAPDAAWVSKEREDSLSSDELDSFPPLCPEFVIEVRSKSDARRMVEAKMQTWLDNGASSRG